MKIALNYDQYTEYLENKCKQDRLEIAKDILLRNENENKNTFLINLLNELMDDLYLLKMDLEELVKEEEFEQ